MSRWIVTKLTGTAAEITGGGESLAASGAGAITDVYNLLNGLAPRWRGNAQWVADQTTLQAINRLVPPGRPPTCP
jgi:predicted phage gp36 major capsid-like protein